MTATIWAWDVETVDWDKPVCAVAVSEHGHVLRFSGSQCLTEMAEWQTKAGGQWIGHAAGIFDTLLISEHRDRPWDEVVMSGSAVLCARDGRHLKLRDSFRWWLASLENIGLYVDRLAVLDGAEPGKLHKQKVDRSRIESLTINEQLAYCESDCHILMAGIKRAREFLASHGARNAWTSGASALALLEALEPDHWRLMGRHALPVDIAIEVGECVRGARTEAFAHGYQKKVWVYDVKSAYPAAYARRPIGLGARKLLPGAEDVHGSVWRCTWHWPHRDMISPVLDQLTSAGCGDLSAWCCRAEVVLLQSAGALDIVRHEGWAPIAMAPIGQTFVDVLYREKESGSFFAKTFLNSLHGKLSESPIKESLTASCPEVATVFGPPAEIIGSAPHEYWRYLVCPTDQRGKVARHIQPLAAAQILGRARANISSLLMQVQNAGGEVYYCDTDSIHCDLSPEMMPFALGGKMGEMACEGGPYEGLYLGPKMYCLWDGAGVQKGALKGVPWKGLKDGVCEGGVYREARNGEKGSDLRLKVFEAISEESARVAKQGLVSWTMGLKTARWKKSQTVRTLKPQPREKQYMDGGWQYLTPDEVIAVRGKR